MLLLFTAHRSFAEWGYAGRQIKESVVLQWNYKGYTTRSGFVEQYPGLFPSSGTNFRLRT